MYDVKLTTENFDGNVSIKKGFDRVYTARNAVVAGISKKQICDLSGKIIAVRAFERKVTEDGEKIKVVVYRQADCTDTTSEILPTDFLLKGDRLYAGDAFAGVVKRSTRNAKNISLLSITAALLVLVLALILLIDIPYAEVPRIVIKDENGYYAEGTVAVFDEKVYPSKQGEYRFIIENPHNAELRYSFRIAPVCNGKMLETPEEIAAFPFVFRLRMNNAVVETEEWLNADELAYTDFTFLPGSDQSFTLEWKWPFENGKDANDTYLGRTEALVSLVLYLTAEVE